ncbi:hypothetical protein EVAR_40595_1 [Eumeta japonica]|uniref:Uncharacterized protein n=1 Tax=Eumeta variegata TaxID=151549 RepID=A0A4C1XIX1_EUMVA|nr:hypothetical protein EVAR_40595_1 [Eumeta japonica]
MTGRPRYRIVVLDTALCWRFEHVDNSKFAIIFSLQSDTTDLCGLTYCDVVRALIFGDISMVFDKPLHFPVTFSSHVFSPRLHMRICELVYVVHEYIETSRFTGSERYRNKQKEVFSRVRVTNNEHPTDE